MFGVRWMRNNVNLYLPGLNFTILVTILLSETKFRRDFLLWHKTWKMCKPVVLLRCGHKMLVMLHSMPWLLPKISQAWPLLYGYDTAIVVMKMLLWNACDPKNKTPRGLTHPGDKRNMRSFQKAFLKADLSFYLFFLSFFEKRKSKIIMECLFSNYLFVKSVQGR